MPELIRKATRHKKKQCLKFIMMAAYASKTSWALVYYRYNCLNMALIPNTQQFIQNIKMSEENSFNSSQSAPISSKDLESSRERLERIKKKKNIRKNKVKQSKQKQIEEIENIPKSQLTKEQKFSLQKQKNRMAAQLSRDRQKQYVQNLEIKIQSLSDELEKQICRKCGNSLTQDSYQSSERKQQLIHQLNIDEQVPEPSGPQNLSSSPSFFLNQDPPVNFFRDESSVSMSFMGKFLFICLICIAVFSFSASIQATSNGPSMNGRLMQEVAPYGYEQSECSFPKSSILDSSIFRNNIIQENKVQQNFPLSYDLSQNVGNFLGEDQCKAKLIQDYFTPPNFMYYPKETKDKLMSCVKPKLIMKTKQNEENGFFNGLFTLVLDNPEIFEVLPSDGQLSLSNVIPLKGLYEMEVEFVNIKKIIGHNCLD